MIQKDDLHFSIQRNRLVCEELNVVFHGDLTPRFCYTADLRIDLENKVIYKKEQVIELSPELFTLLVTLIQGNGKIVSRNVLLQNLELFKHKYLNDNTLNVYISRLRKNLGTYNGKEYIRTRNDLGYTWDFTIK